MEELKSIPNLVERFEAVLPHWSTNGKDQLFHHRPDFPDAFPDSDTAVTEKFLQEKLWWWRFATDDKCPQIFPTWGRGTEFWPRHMLQMFNDFWIPSAMFYEFRARYDKRYSWDFGRPWVKCSVEQVRFLALLVPNEHPAIKMLPQVHHGDPNWIQFPEKFNLRLSDQTLINQFSEALARMREKTGIQKPPRGQGTQRRKQSWKLIEALDFRKFQTVPLSDGERSMLSEANAHYERQCKALGLDP